MSLVSAASPKEALLVTVTEEYPLLELTKDHMLFRSHLEALLVLIWRALDLQVSVNELMLLSTLDQTISDYND